MLSFWWQIDGGGKAKVSQRRELISGVYSQQGGLHSFQQFAEEGVGNQEGLPLFLLKSTRHLSGNTVDFTVDPEGHRYGHNSASNPALHLLSGFLQQPPDPSPDFHPCPPPIYSHSAASLPAETKSDCGIPMLKSHSVTQSQTPVFSAVCRAFYDLPLESIRKATSSWPQCQSAQIWRRNMADSCWHSTSPCDNHTVFCWQAAKN